MSEIKLTDGLFLSPYKKAVVVYGPATQQHNATLKSLGGRWNTRLKAASEDWSGCCWVFPGFKRDLLVRHFAKQRPSVALDEQVIDDGQPTEIPVSNEIVLAPDLNGIIAGDQLLVYGNTYPYRDVFKDLKGRWDSTVRLEHPKGGCCWVIGGPVNIEQLRSRLAQKRQKSDRARAPERAPVPIPFRPGAADHHRDVVVELSKLGTKSLELLLDIGVKSAERTALLAKSREIMPRDRFPDPLERRDLVGRALEASRIDF